MRVRMNRYISGSRNGVEWPPVGGVIDLPEHEANDLIDQGYADWVDDELDDDATDPGGEPGDGRTDAEREADEQAAAAREALRDEVRAKANADEVAAWMGGNPARARLALEVENEGRQRKGLTAQLEAIANQGDDDAATTENTGGPDTDPPGPDGPSSGADATAPAGSDDTGAGDAAASRPW